MTPSSLRALDTGKTCRTNDTRFTRAIKLRHINTGLTLGKRNASPSRQTAQITLH